MFSKRKPYLSSRESMKEFFTAPVRYLKESNRKESQFEKPYLESEYPTMHLRLPDPSWPTWSFPVDDPPSHLPVGLGIGDIEITKRPIGFCSIWCLGYTIRDPEECAREPGGECGVLVVYSKYPDTLSDCHWEITGPLKEQTPGVMLNEIFLYVDWDSLEANSSGYKHATFEVTLVDAVGQRCSDWFTASCKSCTCNGSLAWDDTNSAETINPGDTVTVYVTDGCAPYNWSVSGTGYSMGAASTDTRQNTLECVSGG